MTNMVGIGYNLFVVTIGLNFVRTVPCFSVLPEIIQDRLSEGVSERSAAKGELLLLQGEPCPGLFVIQSGSVKLFRSSERGEEQILRIARRGDCFECVPFFDGGANPVSAEAMSDCQLFFLPSADFQDALIKYPEMTMAFAPVLARRLRMLVHTVGDYSARRVYPRLARLLAEMGERKGGLFQVSELSQHHLSCMLGCSRQVVNASLQRLVKQGIIELERQRIIVKDPVALREIT